MNKALQNFFLRFFYFFFPSWEAMKLRLVRSPTYLLPHLTSAPFNVITFLLLSLSQRYEHTARLFPLAPTHFLVRKHKAQSARRSKPLLWGLTRDLPLKGTLCFLYIPTRINSQKQTGEALWWNMWNYSSSSASEMLMPGQWFECSVAPSSFCQSARLFALKITAIIVGEVSVANRTKHRTKLNCTVEAKPYAPQFPLHFM